MSAQFLLVERKKSPMKKKKECIETEASTAMRKCTGNLRSKNSVEFVACLATRVPAKNTSLSLVARERALRTK